MATYSIFAGFMVARDLAVCCLALRVAPDMVFFSYGIKRNGRDMLNKYSRRNGMGWDIRSKVVNA